VEDGAGVTGSERFGAGLGGEWAGNTSAGYSALAGGAAAPQPVATQTATAAPSRTSSLLPNRLNPTEIGPTEKCRPRPHSARQQRAGKVGASGVRALRGLASRSPDQFDQHGVTSQLLSQLFLYELELLG
jgi:hypothetical protein